MKTLLWATSLALLLTLWGLMDFVAAAQIGGPYELSWSNFDGSAGVGMGGPYQLEGVSGQPDAGTVGGGAYELWGGVSESGPLSGSPVTPSRVYLPLIIRLE